MKLIANLWAALKKWIKSLDEEWDEQTAEVARTCKDES